MNRQDSHIVLGFGLFILMGLAIFYIGFGGSGLSILWFNNNQLTNYSNPNCNLLAQSCSTYAELNVPTDTNNVSFLLGQYLGTTNTGINNWKVDYYAYNYQTGSWQILQSAIHSLPPHYYYNLDTTPYTNNKIGRLYTITTGSSSCYTDTTYYSCLSGMENQLPKDYSDSSGTGCLDYEKYRCVIPGETSIDSYDNIVYVVPQQIRLDSHFINNGVIKIKINAGKISNSDIAYTVKNIWIGYLETTTKPKTYYQFQNNQCTQITISPSEKTSNDYNTLQDCESYIKKNYYEYENNNCTQISLTSSQVTSNDYNTLAECYQSFHSPKNPNIWSSISKIWNSLWSWITNLFTNIQNA